MTFYVYLLLDPKDDEPIYVGLSQSLPSRIHHHFWIDGPLRKLVWENGTVPTVRVVADFEEKTHAHLLEMALIKHLAPSRRLRNQAHVPMSIRWPSPGSSHPVPAVVVRRGTL